MSLFLHISFGVKNYSQSVKFYQKTLSCLSNIDLRIVEGVYPPVIQNNQLLFNGVRFSNIIDLNSGQCLSIIDLEYGIHDQVTSKDIGSPKGLHLCFHSITSTDIDAWYAKALELGASDNGAPGIRSLYGKYYYGAFVIDPNGYRLEACIKNYI